MCLSVLRPTAKTYLAREAKELVRNADGEFEELVDILKTRGMFAATARQAANEMTEHDALATHAREEIGLSDTLAARPLPFWWEECHP